MHPADLASHARAQSDELRVCGISGRLSEREEGTRGK